MAAPIRPSRGAQVVHPNEFQMTVTYAGSLDACVELFRSQEQFDVRFQLTSTSPAFAQVQLEAYHGMTRDFGVTEALRQLNLIDARAQEIGLS